jgi:peptidoglycan/xylan/chitin deacetylase (PgdA/CDA1 family)
MRRLSFVYLSFFVLGMVAAASGADGNRLAHLDEFADPYYPGLQTPKLITPQWIGEEGVEAAIVLSIDDLGDPLQYEAFLRPVFERLKKIDGRAPVSIMSTNIDPKHPQLPAWIAEGVDVETHTATHRAPLFQGGDFAAAKDTFDRCIDSLSSIPNYRPVAFRTPYCDSENVVSPRFFAEIFNKTTPAGRFVELDSSIGVLFTPKDSALPRELVVDEEDRERFFKYVPKKDRNYVGYVENYPYPYVIGRLCWEVPLAMPDDWQGHNLNGPCNPTSLRDMKAAIDAAVLKKGVYTLTFHPHGWVRSEQVIELIDHAVAKYGAKVKFLTLREIHARLTQNLLAGQPLRAADGQDNGVRVADLNGDGYMDVAIGNDKLRQTRVWSPDRRTWETTDFPVEIASTGARFGVLQPTGMASVLTRNEKTEGLWHFDGRQWKADPQGLAGLDLNRPVATSREGRDCGVRLRDVDGNGTSELIVGNDQEQAVFAWSGSQPAWQRLPFGLPAGTAIVDAHARDAGLRFVDLNADGRDDVVFSNASRCAVGVFQSLSEGWSATTLDTEPAGASPIPRIVRSDGTNNGAWLQYGHLYVHNENTAKVLPYHVESRSYEELLGLQAGKKQ